ncbi:MAG: pantetheine-phosphate adenylyltransferase [Lentisphaeria bacterium]|nr:pantetheine-phosphate adenylyltransferase [Lentisphaeria bacterium]NQZ69583.1 pantetheine-phosphate adenylyltransferase [Lentisphaeria bacterium]
MRAIYAFSGDPITYGHIDIVKRASKTYSEVVVAIGQNPDKTGKYLFSVDERLDMARFCLQQCDNVEVLTFDGLLAEYAYRHGFDVIVRGVRNTSDLEGELVFAAVNESLHPTLDTVFFPTRPHLSHISSSVVRALVVEGGDVSDYCPLYVKEKVEHKVLKRTMIGIAGGIASGKTWFANELKSALEKHGLAHYVSLDAVGHYVLSDSDEAIYKSTRLEIANTFGVELMNEDGSINRKDLGQIVFSEPVMLNLLNSIMKQPMMARLYEELAFNSKLNGGVVIIEGAILIEAGWTRLVNNNVILLDADKETRIDRLTERNQLSEEDATMRIERQLSAEDRKQLMEEAIEMDEWGRLWEYKNDGSKIDFDALAKEILDS